MEYLSPRDASGHGTHTSSTAAGAVVENASFMGLAKGSARGGAPSAWLAIYKICWSTGGCSSADLLAAFDDAISDGVDVLSVSLGSYPPLPTYVEDVLAIGSFHAVAKGVSVVCSGGNSGPYPQTVINTAPWIITVAASTIDREFPSVIVLGNNQTLQVFDSSSLCLLRRNYTAKFFKNLMNVKQLLLSNRKEQNLGFSDDSNESIYEYKLGMLSGKQHYIHFNTFCKSFVHFDSTNKAC